MKKLFLIILILSNIESIAPQTTINQDTLIKYVCKALSLIEPTINYADHSHLSEKLLSVVLNHQDDEIFEIIHTRGFNNFTKIVYFNNVSTFNRILTSDSLISIELNEIRSVFPKKLLSTSPEIKSYNIFNDILTIDTWYFTSSNNIQYEFSIVFINTQITSIGYQIFK